MCWKIVMEKIEKTLRYTKLFNLYGALLSEAQQSVLSDYFFMDLSISEISENRGISRAAVEDALSKGTKKLDYYEETLKLLDNRAKVSTKVQELVDIDDKEERKRILQEVLEEIDNGIWESKRKAL